jgi:plasmid stabilization system protein ParE
MIPVGLSQQAIADIDETTAVLQKLSGGIAIRLLDGVELLLDLLAIEPECGMHVRVERPDLPTIRWIRVPGCRSYLAIYRRDDERVEIIRVVHQSMNWLAAITSS